MIRFWEFVYAVALAGALVGVAVWVAGLQLKKKIKEPQATHLCCAVTLVVYVSGLMIYEILRKGTGGV